MPPNLISAAVFPPLDAKTAPAQLPADACGRCKFWFLDSAQPVATAPGQPQQVMALCRRYPPQMLLMEIPNGAAILDPRSGRAARGAPGHQQPAAFRAVTNALDWCGEFRARPPV